MPCFVSSELLELAFTLSVTFLISNQKTRFKFKGIIQFIGEPVAPMSRLFGFEINIFNDARRLD